MNQSELRKDMERIFKSGGIVNPGPGDVHVNRPLTNISLAYMQDAAAFVADSIFPAIPVMKQSDLYWEYDRDDWNRDEAEEMRPGDIGGESDYDDRLPTCSIAEFTATISRSMIRHAPIWTCR